jgi:hypothetical protein
MYFESDSCSGPMGALVPVRSLLCDPGVGGGVGAERHGVSVGLAAAHHHGGGHDMFRILREAHVVPLLVPHWWHEWHVRQAVHDRASGTRGRVLRFETCSSSEMS